MVTWWGQQPLSPWGPKSVEVTGDGSGNCQCPVVVYVLGGSSAGCPLAKTLALGSSSWRRRERQAERKKRSRAVNACSKSILAINLCCRFLSLDDLAPPATYVYPGPDKIYTRAACAEFCCRGSLRGRVYAARRRNYEESAELFSPLLAAAVHGDGSRCHPRRCPRPRRCSSAGVRSF